MPEVPALLDTAVGALGGARRDGQRRMAAAVAHAIDTGEHLAVQAGTGTGKSLGYLVPALRHSVRSGNTVVVSTATIALQRQLVDRDLPRLAQALAGPLHRAPEFAILKGRSNYLCLNRIHSGATEEPADELFDPFAISRMGREITRLREFASETDTGDRDDLDPGVSDAAWRQVSVTARECIGASACPYGADCFAEAARKRAGGADVVVTNHAMLAIDALTGVNVLPDHDVVIVDEAHELVDRITAVATDELSPTSVGLLARRVGTIVDQELADDVAGAGEMLGELLEASPVGRWVNPPDGGEVTLAAIRDRLWRAHTAIGPVRGKDLDQQAAAARTATLTAVEEAHDSVVRILNSFAEPDEARRRDVVWIAEERTRTGDTRRALHVAPLSVGGILRSSLFGEATVILTSATLTIGGSFDALAVTWGLPAGGSGEAPSSSATAEAVDGPSVPDAREVTATGRAVPSDADGSSHSAGLRWNGLDVGSPFDHRKSAILYIAKHLPPPGRAQLPPPVIDELVELITAAGGRTLGLFSSMRAAREATEAVRERVEFPVLCQGEGMTSALVRDFAADEPTCLFGTLSLWQGVDVPGPSLSLVVIDRIPFPRPDDPLLTARQRAVESRGGNGFLSVAASHAGLLLAQGAGRLLRSTSDRGMVAVLDPRLATARYGGFLRSSLPPFWPTTDGEVARASLKRLRPG
ncbi:ATP-dependent DNA helicase [Gordonia jinhuaensis]|uniref:ATP-dependent DNA helicase n=1 Tax=Gordonia jinhuaensis TaxID=1517702 RepID=UPI003570D095